MSHHLSVLSVCRLSVRSLSVRKFWYCVDGIVYTRTRSIFGMHIACVIHPQHQHQRWSPFTLTSLHWPWPCVAGWFWYGVLQSLTAFVLFFFVWHRFSFGICLTHSRSWCDITMHVKPRLFIYKLIFVCREHCLLLWEGCIEVKF